ncbi:MAG: TIGR02710 family CRISPR-associated protein, partial [Chloroflexaceae bacterium]|nr:TIGR02710 family CRISPR-associated protein [Chloroflexaceae bacterium]
MSQPQLPFDEELQRFRARTANERGRYRALVLLGTGQTTTAALLIGALEPERVAILLTERTRSKGFVEEVAQILHTSAAPWLVPDGNYETADAVYRGLKYVLDQWHASWPDLDRRTIAADVTGGFATMSVGLAKAAHVLRLKTVYVRSDYADIGGRSQPVPGTQQLEFPPDPYAVFGDLEAAEAQRLYAAHDYAGAERIFADLEQRVPGGPDAHRYAG